LLARKRFLSLGGEKLVEHGSETDSAEDEHNQDEPAEA
jgi:hypothetical protein